MADNVPGDYVWSPKTNNSFIGQCHIETGGSWLRFEFDSRLGRIERQQDTAGNPLLIVTEGGARVALRGAVTIVAPDTQELGTVTFTPQDEGITDWHWTHTRDGETFTEEGSGIFLREAATSEPQSAPEQDSVAEPEFAPKPQPAALPRETTNTIAARKKTTPKKVAAKKPVKKKAVAKKSVKKAIAKKSAKKRIAKKAAPKKAKKPAAKKAAPRKKAKAVKKPKKGTRGK